MVQSKSRAYLSGRIENFQKGYSLLFFRITSPIFFEDVQKYSRKFGVVIKIEVKVFI